MKISGSRIIVPTLLAGIALFTPFASAKELAGVSAPESILIKGKKLSLNGMGIRQATIFRVNVYVATLYLEILSHDGEAIIDSNQLKQVGLTFVRDVGAEKMRDAWSESFKKNCPKYSKASCDTLQPSLTRMNAAMQDMKKGDSMVFTFLDGSVEVTVKGKSAGVLSGVDLVRTMLSSWIGQNPPNESLREGMLGQR